MGGERFIVLEGRIMSGSPLAHLSTPKKGERCLR